VAEEFYPEKFIYDAQQDIYRCPAGESLRHKGRDFRVGVVFHQYRAKPEAGAVCAFRAKCCPQNVHHGRSIIRAEEAPAVRQFAEKMQTEPAKAIYRQRGAVAEFPNA
jgi:Transposase DDE domain